MSDLCRHLFLLTLRNISGVGAVTFKVTGVVSAQGFWRHLQKWLTTISQHRRGHRSLSGNIYPQDAASVCLSALQVEPFHITEKTLPSVRTRNKVVSSTWAVRPECWWEPRKPVAVTHGFGAF